MPNLFNKVFPFRFLPYHDKAFPVRFPVLIRQISEASSVLQLKASTSQVLYKFPVPRDLCQKLMTSQQQGFTYTNFPYKSIIRFSKRVS